MIAESKPEEKELYTSAFFVFSHGQTDSLTFQVFSRRGQTDSLTFQVFSSHGQTDSLTLQVISCRGQTDTAFLKCFPVMDKLARADLERF